MKRKIKFFDSDNHESYDEFQIRVEDWMNSLPETVVIKNVSISELANPDINAFKLSVMTVAIYYEE